MPRKTIFKISIDCMMTVMLLLLMAYSLIGEALHEWLGIGMLLLFVLHHILNASWYRNLRRGRYSAYRILQTVIAVLLLFMMLAVMMSGIVMSRYTFPFLPLRGFRSLARTLHLPCSYWGFVLMSLHLGLHWGMMMRVLHLKAGNAASGIGTGIRRAAAVLIVLYGVIAFIRNDILSYLLMRTHFVFLDFEQPLVLFFADYLAMMGLFVFIAYYAGRFLQRKRSAAKGEPEQEEAQ
ncbi:MAG: DUF4405 domain-containing protein [Lachnospiraceae bacterium]|nr:DUF4405 domain-containing protein [Lachnospiraceae bacterium]